MKPLKILYLIDTLEVGGSEQSLLEIARGLDRRRFEPVVCSAYRGDALRPAFEAAGVRTVGLGLEDRYRFLQGIRHFVRTIRAEQPDLIHTTLFRADQIGRIAAFWTGIPVVSSFVNLSYDPLRLIDNPQLSRWKLEAVRGLDALTARCVTRFHAVSAAVGDANAGCLGIPRERIDIVPRGRPPIERPTASEDDGNDYRRQMNAPDADPLLVNVGRLVDQKGQKYLIDAMVRVIRQYPRAQLLIAGEGRMRTALAERIARHRLERHVHLLGARSDIPRLLHIADQFVLPSLYEGMPGALIEAMMAGKPVISTDMPVIRELVDHGKTGILVPVCNPERLADAIISLAADSSLCSRLGAAARECAGIRFSIEKVVRAMEEFYLRVFECEGCLNPQTGKEALPGENSGAIS